jgi:hypothetical protein
MIWGDSGRAFQGCRKCPDHETKLLQDHGCEPVSSGDSVFEKGVGMEGGGALGMRPFFLFLTSRPSIFSFDHYRRDGHELTPFSPPFLFCCATNSSRISTWRSRLRRTIQCRTCSRWVYGSIDVVVFVCAKTRAFEQSFATDGHLIVNYRSVTSLLGTSPPSHASHLMVRRTVRLQRGVNCSEFPVGGLRVCTTRAVITIIRPQQPSTIHLCCPSSTSFSHTGRDTDAHTYNE